MDVSITNIIQFYPQPMENIILVLASKGEIMKK